MATTIGGWRGSGRPLLLGHRGDARCATENTIPALVAAIAAGADGVELDVRSSKDGIPVLSHDPDLVRLRGVDRAVSALTAAELEAIGISTLADALAVLPRRAFIDVELKDAPTHTTVEVLAAGRGPDLARAVVSSFDVAALSRIRALAPAWDRWLNVEAIIGEAIGLALGLQCAAIAAEWHAIDERSAAAVRGAGLSLAAWTVRRRPSARRLARLGVVAMCVEGRALGPWASIAGQAGRDA